MEDLAEKIQELKKELEAQEEPGKRDLELRKEIEKLEKVETQENLKK